VDALALLAEQAEDLDRPVVGRPEPVRQPRVELGDLARPMVMSWSARIGFPEMAIEVADRSPGNRP
jgi:hypothetical protein